MVPSNLIGLFKLVTCLFVDFPHFRYPTYNAKERKGLIRDLNKETKTQIQYILNYHCAADFYILTLQTDRLARTVINSNTVVLNMTFKCVFVVCFKFLMMELYVLNHTYEN